MVFSTPDWHFLWNYLESNSEAIYQQEVFPAAEEVAENAEEWKDQMPHLSFDWDFGDENVVLRSPDGMRYHLPSVRLHFLFGVTQKTLTLGESLYKNVRVLSDTASLGENSSEVSIALTEKEDAGDVNLGLHVSSKEEEWTIRFEDMSLQTISLDFAMFMVSDEVVDLPGGSDEKENDLPEYILRG